MLISHQIFGGGGVHDERRCIRYLAIDICLHIHVQMYNRTKQKKYQTQLLTYIYHVS